MTIHQTRTAPSRRVLPAARQPGPVTLAIRGVRPNSLPSWEMREQQLADERRALKALRKRIKAQIDADLARVDRCLNALDLLDGDADLEDNHDAEPSLGSLGGTAGSRGCSQLQWSRGSADDQEAGDDNGIGDTGGLAEQRGRHLTLMQGGAA